MARPFPRLHERSFEARYSHGYRYLDRCGDVLLILEAALSKQTGLVWMPVDPKPTGAAMKCPEAEIGLFFDTERLGIIQSQEYEIDFEAIIKTVVATLSGRLDLREFVRLGFRRKMIIGTNSVEEADNLSLGIPLDDWPTSPSGELRSRSRLATHVFETPDRSKGVNFSVRPIIRTAAEERVDPRLRQAPHLVPENQREALHAQLRQRREARDSPRSGLELDCDYYWIWPKKVNLPEFFKESSDQSEMLFKAFLRKTK